MRTSILSTKKRRNGRSIDQPFDLGAQPLEHPRLSYEDGVDRNTQLGGDGIRVHAVMRHAPKRSPGSGSKLRLNEFQSALNDVLVVFLLPQAAEFAVWIIE